MQENQYLKRQLEIFDKYFNFIIKTIIFIYS